MVAGQKGGDDAFMLHYIRDWAAAALQNYIH